MGLFLVNHGRKKNKFWSSTDETYQILVEQVETDQFLAEAVETEASTSTWVALIGLILQYSIHAWKHPANLGSINEE